LKSDIGWLELETPRGCEAASDPKIMGQTRRTGFDEA
jgi:hypothetical protein